MSTTAVLFKLHAESNGDLAQAFTLLKAWKGTVPNAPNAERVLLTKAKKVPGANRFVIERSGFVVVEVAA